MSKYATMTVGQIVTDSFSNAEVFSKFGIDFCCNGSDSLATACMKRNVDVSLVLEALNSHRPVDPSNVIEFNTWPIDLLNDYILKIHHRNIRKEGPEIQVLLDKVCNAHSQNHPELLEIRAIFTDSLADLYNHLDKEEAMLFPYIYELVEASAKGLAIPPFHCGTVEAPISVMMAEHDGEGERYRIIEALTHGYKAPADACNSYRLLMDKLKRFNIGLHQHIHLENNIVFPAAIELERKGC